MKERYTGQPESQQPKSNVVDFEAAAQKGQAGEKSQIHRPVTPSPAQKEQSGGSADNQLPHGKIDPAPPENHSADNHHHEKFTWTPADDTLVNDIFGGQSQEEITAHNEKSESRLQKERLEKEKLHQEALGYYNEYQEKRAKITPEELEAENKWREEMRKGFEHFLSPEGRKEYVVSFVQDLKARGILPPDLDHFWVNLPSGWAEYRKIPGSKGQEGPSCTVTLDTEPTDEQWEEYYTDLQEKMHSWKAEKARREAVALHAGDPRYDPMTGDLLLPDEHPLNASAEYTFDGKNRVRSFVHPKARSFLSPDSPLLNHRKPLQTDEKDTSESESNERLVNRLLKAGFIEVEPTLMDEASFEKTQWYRSLSATEKMAYLQAYRQEMSLEKPSDKNDSFFRKSWELIDNAFKEILKTLAEEMARLMYEPEEQKRP
jgi:hypothetical protein